MYVGIHPCRREKRKEVMTSSSLIYGVWRGAMEIKHKKLIGEEILWFSEILILSFAFMLMTQMRLDYGHGIVVHKFQWIRFLGAFVFQYFLRTVAWAILTLKKQ